MTDHPAKDAGCTKAQITAFELIANGDVCGHSRRTLNALASKGLVDFVVRSNKDALGSYTWKEPFVPMSVHVQWCAWCAENVKDEAAQ